MDLNDLLGEESPPLKLIISSKEVATHWTPNRTWGHHTYEYKGTFYSLAKTHESALEVRTEDGVTGLRKLKRGELLELPRRLRS